MDAQLGGKLASAGFQPGQAMGGASGTRRAAAAGVWAARQSARPAALGLRNWVCG